MARVKNTADLLDILVRLQKEAAASEECPKRRPVFPFRYLHRKLKKPAPEPRRPKEHSQATVGETTCLPTTEIEPFPRRRFTEGGARKGTPPSPHALRRDPPKEGCREAEAEPRRRRELLPGVVQPPAGEATLLEPPATEPLVFHSLPRRFLAILTPGRSPSPVRSCYLLSSTTPGPKERQAEESEPPLEPSYRSTTSELLLRGPELTQKAEQVPPLNLAFNPEEASEVEHPPAAERETSDATTTETEAAECRERADSEASEAAFLEQARSEGPAGASSATGQRRKLPRDSGPYQPLPQYEESSMPPGSYVDSAVTSTSSSSQAVSVLKARVSHLGEAGGEGDDDPEESTESLGPTPEEPTGDGPASPRGKRAAKRVATAGAGGRQTVSSREVSEAGGRRLGVRSGPSIAAFGHRVLRGVVGDGATKAFGRSLEIRFGTLAAGLLVITVVICLSVLSLQRAFSPARHGDEFLPGAGRDNGSGTGFVALAQLNLPDILMPERTLKVIRHIKGVSAPAPSPPGDEPPPSEVDDPDPVGTDGGWFIQIQGFMAKSDLRLKPLYDHLSELGFSNLWEFPMGREWNEEPLYYLRLGPYLKQDDAERELRRFKATVKSDSFRNFDDAFAIYLFPRTVRKGSPLRV